MASPGSSYWTPTRIAIWAGVAVLVSLWLGPKFVRHFRPPDNRYMDFSQEWLSAKNYWAGTPVYAEQTESLHRHTGQTAGPNMLRWNAHPPATTALTLPFGKLSYPDAVLAWNLLTFPLFLVSIALVGVELRFPWRAASVLAAVPLVLVCDPIYQQIAQGQLNFLLVFLITLAWAADRHERPGWAGIAVGVAAGLKLFPAFLFAYFLFTRRWRALATGGAAFLAVNGLALAVLGAAEFQTYLREVIPYLPNYQASWSNASLTGFWLRVFDPQPHDLILPLAQNPVAAQALVWASRLVITAVVVFAAWRARSLAARDRAFAAAVVGMVLVSPIAWTHYFVLLVLPVAFVWATLDKAPLRWLMVGVFVFLWFPSHFLCGLALGHAEILARINGRASIPIPPNANLGAVSIPTYALLALFVLVLLTPAARAEPAENREDGAVESSAGGK